MLQQRWEQEQVLAGQIGALRGELEAAGGQGLESGVNDLRALNDRLRGLQGDAPLVPVQVDGHTVAEIVAAWTGIPLGRMVKDEIRTVVNLQAMLDERILGQQHASGVVAQRVRTARANLDDPNKPKGVFLFVGTSGVGKTETALALADILYGGERKLITINMSEYQEAHSVSGLKGSPPGYVGYGEGGVLTEAVRRNPYSVVLLDEAEKAHPDVLEMFFQVFDKGVMDDAEGRQIDFRNTIIILTSNVGSSQLMAACLNKPASERPTPGQLSELLRPVLMKHFKPAFLGRLAVVPFYPIGDEVLANIIRLKLTRIGARDGQPPRPFRVRRGAGVGGPEPLHRGRFRRAQCRQRPERHLAAGDRGQRAGPHGRRRRHRAREGRRHQGRQVQVPDRAGAGVRSRAC